MTTKVSYSKKYYNRWAPYEDSWNQVVLDETDELHWDRAKDLPAGTVMMWLQSALQCAYAADDLRCGIFLRRADYFADRLIAEKRYLDTDVAVFGHPRELADILRFRAYTRWLLGNPLNRKDLRQAASDYVEWCLTKAEDKRRFSDSLTMAFYLEGVRAAIVTGDLDYASELLTTQQPFRWHHARERELWKRLTASYPKVDDELKQDMEVFFDRVRDPDFEDRSHIGKVFVRSQWLALDTGIIRQMYIINPSPDVAVDPKAVIGAVAY